MEHTVSVHSSENQSEGFLTLVYCNDVYLNPKGYMIWWDKCYRKVIFHVFFSHYLKVQESGKFPFEGNVELQDLSPTVPGLSDQTDPSTGNCFKAR